MTDPQRYLVYRCGWQGLGHIGVAVLNCARAAAATGRMLALDMRGFRYYREDAARCFDRDFGFELPPGVVIVTDPEVVAQICALPDRYEPPAWQGPDPIGERAEQVVIITSDVVRHVHSLDNKSVFLPARWVLKGALAERVRPALLAPQLGVAVIGVYFRSGNGEFLDFRFDPVSLPDYAARYEELIERYADIARLAARQFPGRRVRYYVASDSAEFVAAMRARLGDVVSRGAGGIGGLFRSVVEAANDGLDALADAVIDVWNLARCDGLIHNPSLFPEFAALNGEHHTASTAFCVEPSTLRAVLDRRETPAALDYLDCALARQPLFWWRVRAGTLRFRAEVLARAGEAAPAAALARRAEQLEACFAREGMLEALALLNELRAEDAREKALDVASPDCAYVAHFVAMAEFFLGRHGDALARIEAALGAWPDFPELHVARVRLLAARGLVTRAARVAAQALDLRGPDPALRAEHERMASRILGDGRVLRNVAIGCRAQQSSHSRWSRPDDPQGLVNGIALTGFQMHTETQDDPGWEVDLGRDWPVRSIAVFNRDEEALWREADGLIIEGLADGGAWKELGRARRRFTGASGGDPLRLWFDPLPVLRAVRVRLEGRRTLHLQQVEVFAADAEPEQM